jgi:HK97 gp10 family phage protein
VAKQHFSIEGLSEFESALGELRKATARNVLVRTLKQVAAPVEAAAKRLAPDDPSTASQDLKAGIKTESVPSKFRESHAEVAIGPTKEEFHGVFQELGVPHHAPQPFLRPALDQNARTVVGGFKTTLAGEIEKARKRAARKAERLAAKMGRA